MSGIAPTADGVTLRAPWLHSIAKMPALVATRADAARWNVYISTRLNGRAAVASFFEVSATRPSGAMTAAEQVQAIADALAWLESPDGLAWRADFDAAVAQAEAVAS